MLSRVRWSWASIHSGAKNIFAQKIDAWMMSLQALNVCDLAWLDFLFCFIMMMTKPVGESSDDKQELVDKI